MLALAVNVYADENNKKKYTKSNKTVPLKY